MSIVTTSVEKNPLAISSSIISLKGNKLKKITKKTVSTMKGQGKVSEESSDHSDYEIPLKALMSIDSAHLSQITKHNKPQEDKTVQGSTKSMPNPLGRLPISHEHIRKRICQIP